MLVSVSRVPVLAVLSAAFGLAGAPASAATDQGLTYTLTELLVTATQAQYTLDITGINGVLDTKGGRSAVGAFAFSMPANFQSATMDSPTGWTFVSSGLGAQGCSGGGNFFCFDNASVPPVPTTPLAQNSSLSFDLTVIASASGSFPYTPNVKVAWVGSANYGVVNLTLVPVSAVPEVESYAMLMAGLGVVGVASRRRKQRGQA